MLRGKHRDFAIHMCENAGVVTDSVSWEQQRGTAGAVATLNDRDELTFVISGDAPENEDNAVETAKRLVWALNARGAAWSEAQPAPGSDDHDANSTWAGDAKRVLLIQVVRIANGARWRDLRTNGAIAEEIDFDAAADELRAAIAKKEGKHYARKSSLTLAIDVSQLPSHTLAPVLRAFEARYGDEARAIGFESIWVVGPSVPAVFPLAARTRRP